MKRSISLRLRVTLVCGLLLTVCCLLLTLSHNYYANEMADAIEALPLQPAQSVGSSEESIPSEIQAPTLAPSISARKAFRTQSLVGMTIIVVSGCLLVYWLTGKALSPLHQLDEQIRNRTAADLDKPLPVPSSGDEVMRLTISFNQMSENLSAAFAQQKRFAQCAAHELRTPLTVLKTRMSLFRKKGLCSTPETAELLRVLEEQTNRLSGLVGDLLSLTNLDSVDCREEVSLSQLLSKLITGMAEEAHAHQTSIQFQPAAGVVPGNSLLLERAFFNLIENAIHYNRPLGIVSVSMKCREDFMEVRVQDEGIGIPPELREQIFEPFFRVDKSRSRQFGGAGLGLSIVRAIVELHHGEIRVESSPEQGSCFVVRLPCLMKEQPEHS